MWDPHLKKEITALKKVQRRAAHFVTVEYSREKSVTNMLSELQWPTLKQHNFVTHQNLLWKAVSAMTHIRQIRGIFDITISCLICSSVISMVPFTHAAFFVVKNCMIKRGLEQKNCVIKKSLQICLMCVMALNNQVAVSIPPHIKPSGSQSRGHNHTFINISARTDNYKYSLFPKTICCVMGLMPPLAEG